MKKHSYTLFSKMTWFVLLTLAGHITHAQILSSAWQPPGNEQWLQKNQARPLKTLLKTIGQKYNVSFSYESSLLREKSAFPSQKSLASLEEELDELLRPFELKYRKLGKNIYVIFSTQQESPSGAKPETKKETSFFSNQAQYLVPVIIGINGKVSDASSGEAIPGVNVIVKGTAIGTATDADGSYQINVPDERAILVFSSIGFTSEEISVGNQTTIDVQLVADIKTLSEVLVVGYGTNNKRDITGSVATINSENLIQNKSVSNFDAALQGLAPGVSVQTTSGVPGAPVDIRIRGVSSISAGVEPLWIIDGMPLYSGSRGLQTNEEGTPGQSPMSLINPNDIESIQILKDAAATSIYGSRGSNGVIIITTKSGKKGQSTINIDITGGVGDLTRKPEDIGFASTGEWFKVMDEVVKADGFSQFEPSLYYEKSPYAKTLLSRQQALGINTNWFNEILRKASYRDVNLSSSAGFDKGSFYLSVNYRDENSILKHNDFKRFSTRANVDFRPTNNLTLGGKFSFAATKNNRVKNDGKSAADTGNKNGTSGGFNLATNGALPWFPVYDINNPKEYYNALPGTNPTAAADPSNLKDELEQYRGLGGLFAEYKFPFIEGLSLRSELSADIIQSNKVFWVSKSIRALGSYATDEAISFQSINTNLYATYNRTFGDHHFNLVGGTESQRDKTYTRRTSGQNLVGNYQELGSPSSRDGVWAGITGERYLMAYFGRFNYKFKDRYLAGISARRDGSSAFTKNYRWGTFVAGSLGWILSEESFMDFAGNNTFLKLRGSYGQTGNQNIPGGLNVTGYRGGYSYGSDDIFGLNGTLVSNIGVASLTWEKTNSSDIGLDFGFLNHRLTGSVAYYHKYVKDMLLSGPAPFSTGIADWIYVENSNIIWANIGDMVNRGLELELSTLNLDVKGFKWSTSFNITTNDNEVKKLIPSADAKGTGILNGELLTKKGSGINEWMLARYAGIDRETGIEMIYALDQEHYKTSGITRTLKTAVGTDSLLYATGSNIRGNRFHLNGKSPIPTFYGGLTNRFEYKGFDFSFLITFSGGNYIYDYDEQLGVYPDGTRVIRKDYLDNYWTEERKDAKYPKPAFRNGYIIDGKPNADFPRQWLSFDRFLYKGDFIRLKNVQLGYSFPSGVNDKLRLQGLRVWMSATNLLTKTDYKGWDPEGASYVYFAQIPQLKYFNAGINARF